MNCEHDADFEYQLPYKCELCTAMFKCIACFWEHRYYSHLEDILLN